jgi:hypothetical protein
VAPMQLLDAQRGHSNVAALEHTWSREKLGHPRRGAG